MKINSTYLLFLFASFILFFKANAQSTEELLRSTRVNNFIYLEPDIINKTVEYQIDKMRDNKKFGKPLTDKLSVTVSPRDQSINLLVKYFNPFQNKIVLSDTLLTDDNYEALNKFFESISSLVNVISEKNPSINPEKIADGAARSTLVNISALRSPLLQQWKYLFNHGKIIDCTPAPANLIKALEKADKAFYSDEDESFEKRLKTGLSKITSAKNLIQLNAASVNCPEVIDKANELNQESKGFIAVLENEVKNLSLADPAKVGLNCEDFERYTKDVLQTFINDIKEKQKKREEIHGQLVELNKSLDAFLKTSTTVSVDGIPMEAVRIGTYTVNEEKVREVTMIIKERTVTFDNNKISVTDKNDILSRKVRIRSHRPLIPEFATGLFYTSLKYKTFIANDNGDSIVVAEGKEEKSSVVVAAHLNLVFDVWTDATPMIQIGVGTAKDRPSILLGGGLRFSKPKRLSISLGGIWTWKQELTNLKVGQKLKESAELQKDLKYNLDTKPSFYVGLQYNF